MKNILIVGGNSGIGLAFLKLATANGCNISVASRKKPEINNPYNHIFFDALEPEIKPEIIPEQLDGLIYFPGTINLKPFNRIADKEWQDELAINFFGAVKWINACLPSLKKNSNASVVLFSTVAVSIGMPFHSSIASAKGAIEGLTKSLAAEFAPNIRFNAIAPSLTESALSAKFLSTPEKVEASAKRHPLNKIGDANDMAKLAWFLLNDESKFITGQILHADGGMSSIKLI